MSGTPVNSSPDPGTVERRLISVHIAAEVLGINRRELYRRIAAGDIETVRIGRRRLIPVVELDAYVAGLRDQAAAERLAGARAVA